MSAKRLLISVHQPLTLMIDVDQRTSAADAGQLA
jgi:hypothetical protein